MYKYGISLNKLFEYFGSGKPVLGNIETPYDFLQQYGCGLSVSGGSSEAIAMGILDFYNMPQGNYNEYCQNSKNTANKFDYNNLTNELENIISELIQFK